MKNSVELIREIEQNKLDVEFEKYPITDLIDDISIPYLLKIYGDIHREFVTFNRSDFVSRRELYVLLQATGHCIRWVTSKIGHKLEDNLTSEDLNNFALELLLWGREYSLVANQFIAWSRGLISAEIDLSKKEIEFFPPDKTEMFFNFQQDMSSEEIMSDYFKFMPFDEIHNVYQNWITELDLNEPPIILNWEIAKKNEISKKLQEKISDLIFNEVPHSTDLGGYTIDEFVIFYVTLFLNFHFIETIEDHIDRNTNYENPFGSNPIPFPKEKMIAFLVDMTGLDANCVESILNDLTFNTKNFHSNLTNQPFIVSSTNTYYILPRIFANIEPERMLIGALNKSQSKKKIYDNLINPIEKINLDRIVSLFLEANNELSIFREKRFARKGRIITPDLIIIDNLTKEIIICDYKHFLMPINTSETIFRIKEVDKGIEQITKYLEFIKSEDLLGLKNEYKYFGLLLSRNPLPMPIKNRQNIYITDNNTLQKLLKRNVNFESLMTSLHDRSDLEITSNDFFFDEIRTIVDDWTFVRKIYAAN